MTYTVDRPPLWDDDTTQSYVDFDQGRRALRAFDAFSLPEREDLEQEMGEDPSGEGY